MTVSVGAFQERPPPRSWRARTSSSRKKGEFLGLATGSHKADPRRVEGFLQAEGKKASERSFRDQGSQEALTER